MVKQVTGSKPPPIPGPERITRWQAPTRRWLQPGKRFKIRDVPGCRRMPGEWVFIAYVASANPYVECRKFSEKRANVRAVDPERVYAVANEHGVEDD